MWLSEFCGVHSQRSPAEYAYCMPLNPSPTIDDGLCLITQQFLRSDMSRKAEITFALSHVAPMNLAEAQDTIDDFQANFNANMTARIDSQVSILPPTAKCGVGTATPIEVTAAGGATVGGNAGTMVPPNVALLVQKRTAFGGKKNRGRFYLPFCIDTADCSENGTILSTLVTIFQTECNTFLAQLATDNTPMVIANRTYNTPLPPHYVTAITTGPQVTSLNVENLVATQRRRLAR